MKLQQALISEDTEGHKSTAGSREPSSERRARRRRVRIAPWFEVGLRLHANIYGEALEALYVSDLGLAEAPELKQATASEQK